MWMSILHICVMGFAFLYMFNKAQFAQTRLVALAPLGMLMVDACVFGVGMASLLAIAGAMLRLTVLICCVAAMKKDARLARARARKRAAAKIHLQNAGWQAPSRVACAEQQYA